MKDRIYAGSEIVAILDKEWDSCYEMARLGVISKREACDKSSGILKAAKALGLGDEFVNYQQPNEPRADEMMLKAAMAKAAPQG
jgi:hypothetical protein